MRFSDIQQLTWANVQHSEGTGYFVRFKQKKTSAESTLFIPLEAYGLFSLKCDSGQKVFPGLYYSAWKNLQLKEWFHNAGIFRKLTFHCGRHTFATLQLNLGTDITVVSNLLGHRNLKTTQIYAKITNARKLEAVNRISLA